MDVSTMVLDQYDDDGFKVFFEIVDGMKGDSRNEMLKCAEQTQLLNQEELSSLRQDQFALSIITKTGEVVNKFPINDPSQTWLSTQYFMKTAGQLPEMPQVIVCRNLHHAANIWGLELPYEIEKIASNYSGLGSYHSNIWVEDDGIKFQKTEDLKVLDSMSKIARDPKKQDNRYWGLTNGGVCRYPLQNQDQVKIASSYFDKNYRSFTPSERNEFATRITARSIEFGIPEYAQTPSIMKFAGITFGDQFSDNIRKRVELCEELHKDGDIYNELVKNAEDLGPVQTAVGLELIDSALGLNRYHNKSLEDPYASVMGNHFVKKANQQVEVNGRMVSENELRNVNEPLFKRSYGDSVWNEFQRNPVAIFESMPKPDQVNILEMIGSSDVDEEDLIA